MDKFEALRHYKELLDMEIITQQEFEDKKRALLGIGNKEEPKEASIEKTEAAEKTSAEQSVEQGAEQNEEEALRKAAAADPADGEVMATEVAAEEVAAEGEAADAGSAPAEGEAAVTETAAETITDAVTAEKPGKKKSKALIVIGIICILAIAAACMFLLNGKNSSDNADNVDTVTEQNSIDYVEPTNVTDSFTVCGALVSLTNGWKYEKSGEFYTISLDNKEDKFFAVPIKSVLKGATEDEQIANYYDIFLPSFMGAYPNGEITTQEHITRDGKPAYHLVFHDDVEKVTYDNYMFMANENDMLIAMWTYSDSTPEDHSSDFLEYVRNIKTEV